MPLPPDPFDLMEKELASDGAGDNYFAPDHLSIQGFDHFQGRAPQLYRGPVSDDPGLSSPTPIPFRQRANLVAPPILSRYDILSTQSQLSSNAPHQGSEYSLRREGSNRIQPVANRITSSGTRTGNQHSATGLSDAYQAAETMTSGGQTRQQNGICLRPVSDLPDVYRTIFKFGVFNAMQSQCLDTALRSDRNMVISAPTGSGKTVLFELAIIRLLMSDSSAKCVYMAPTKALCSERYTDWVQKFAHIGVKCCEITGDSIFSGPSAWKEVKNNNLIITTPEKWDSLTRNWMDHTSVLSLIQLIMVDEVHILNETRGSVVEVCVSRMKTRGSSVRFVLLSATVPNIEDIAAWISAKTSDYLKTPAQIFKFGEEYRPCRITRHIQAYPQKQQNDHQFSRMLDFKLFDLLQRYSEGKPTLVFCPTRKGVVATADQLAKEYAVAINGKQRFPWPKPTGQLATFQDKSLNALRDMGIGIHHAGLQTDDRRLVEKLFIEGILYVVVATSTLAVGVNLPAHTVVIKGTVSWSGTGWAEYSEFDLIQMVGRAGRPQFDTHGTAIIMCSAANEHKYRNLESGTTQLESCLHLNLTEHLNSEIGLGTVNSSASAMTWLRNSFFFQCFKRNPLHYSIGVELGGSLEDQLTHLVNHSVQQLKETKMVMTEDDGRRQCIKATEYGEIMSKYYLRYNTMRDILDVPERSGMREILELLAKADEFSSIHLRGGDKAVYNKLNDHEDIRFPLKRVEKSSDKVMTLIQAVLGGIPLGLPQFKTADSQPGLEALMVFKHIVRIAKAFVDVALVKRNGTHMKFGLQLVRNLSSKAWEDRPVVLKQLPQIGEKSIKVLGHAGITSFQKLRVESPARIEMLLNRRAPFGHDIMLEVKSLPHYSLQLSEESISSSDGVKPVIVTLSVEAGLTAPLLQQKEKKTRYSSLGFASILTLTSDQDFVDFRLIPVQLLREPKSYTVSVALQKPSQSVIVMISSQNFAGLTVTATYKPNIPCNQYPTMETRPLDNLHTNLKEIEALGEEAWVLSEEEIQDLTGTFSTPLKPNARQDNFSKNHIIPIASVKHECNHTCKDKTICRHLCCRDGISKPSTSKKVSAGPFKRRASPNHASAAEKILPAKQAGENTSMSKMAGDPFVTAKAATWKGNKPQKGDHALEGLEPLHHLAAGNTSSTSRSGQRLTIGRTHNSRSKRKSSTWDAATLPTFTNLDDCSVNLIASSQEDDEILEPIETLLGLKHASPFTDPKLLENSKSSSTNYSDPDLDAMLACASPSLFSHSNSSRLTQGAVSSQNDPRKNSGQAVDPKNPKSPIFNSRNKRRIALPETKAETSIDLTFKRRPTATPKKADIPHRNPAPFFVLSSDGLGQTYEDSGSGFQIPAQKGNKISAPQSSHELVGLRDERNVLSPLGLADSPRKKRRTESLEREHTFSNQGAHDSDFDFSLDPAFFEIDGEEDATATDAREMHSCQITDAWRPTEVRTSVRSLEDSSVIPPDFPLARISAGESFLEDFMDWVHNSGDVELVD